MATVTLDMVQSKLLSIEEVTQVLQMTEPLDTTLLTNEASTGFQFAPDWAAGLAALDSTDVVDAVMRINGTEHQITKEAIFQAGANFGLPRSYMSDLPSNYTQSLLNYHYGAGMGDSAFNVLTVNDTVSAFTRPTVVPFSNIALLESVINGIQDKYPGIDIYADHKYTNSLLQTDVRLITPAISRVMEDTGMRDIPDGFGDDWLSGIHLRNSLIGKVQTSLEAYSFRYWCANGCTTTLDNIGTWSRRTDGQDEDAAYEWARQSVDEILGHMDPLFDQVQALANLNVNGNIVDVLREIFTQYEVPVSQRDSIMENLQATPNLTMYHVQQAITQAANEEGMPDRRRDRLMRIGGALPTKQFDTLKAKIWREGHAAGDGSQNPYEPIRVRV